MRATRPELVRRLSPSAESARSDWADGQRRLLEAARDPVVAERLDLQVAVVLDELRRRVGSTFTLEELATEYGHAERWARDVVGEFASSPGWPTFLSIAQDAAFHLYARGAVDYEP